MQAGEHWALLSGLLAAGTAFLTLRLRQRHAERNHKCPIPQPVARQRIETFAAPQARTLEAAPQVHLRFHAVSAEDVTAILRQHDGGGAIMINRPSERGPLPMMGNSPALGRPDLNRRPLRPELRTPENKAAA